MTDATRIAVHDSQEGTFWDVGLTDDQCAFAEVDPATMRCISVMIDEEDGRVSLNAGYVPRSPEGEAERALYDAFRDPIAQALVEDRRTAGPMHARFRDVQARGAADRLARIADLRERMAEADDGD